MGRSRSLSRIPVLPSFETGDCCRFVAAGFVALHPLDGMAHFSGRAECLLKLHCTPRPVVRASSHARNSSLFSTHL